MEKQESKFDKKIVLTIPRDHSSSSQSVQCTVTCSPSKILVRMVSLADLLEMHIAKIDAARFETIKAEQDLRINFDRFREKLVQLFEEVHCKKIVAVFSKETGKFVFLDQNDFRNIVLLEIRFYTPSDSEFRSYILENHAVLQRENSRLVKEICFVTERSAEAEKRAKALGRENRELAEKLGTETKKVLSARAELGEVKKQLQQINTDFGDLQSVADQCRVLRESKENWEQKAKKYAKHIENRTEDIETANAIISRLRTEIDRKNDRAEEHASAVAALRERASAHEHEALRANTEGERISRANSELVAKTEELKKEISALSAALSDAKRANENRQQVYEFLSKRHKHQEDADFVPSKERKSAT